MQKKFILFAAAAASALLAVSLSAAPAGQVPVLEIKGSVKHELSLDLNELRQFQSSRCQLNDIKSSHDFNGVFTFQGVPLKTLLEAAEIEKKKKGFGKHTDIAFAVKNKQDTAALSWGEVFYRNPSSVFIAFSSSPVLPHKGCSKKFLEKYHRNIRFPRLVITEDKYSDRCLEGVTEIKVIEFASGKKPGDDQRLYSQEFRVRGCGVKEEAVFKNLDKRKISAVQTSLCTVGEGKGFHGISSFRGYSFTEVLNLAGVKPELSTIFRVSAPDNYHASLSWGEVYLNPAGKRMFFASRRDGKKLETGGKYSLIIPDDLMADRWVKAVESIKVINLE